MERTEREKGVGSGGEGEIGGGRYGERGRGRNKWW